MDILFSLLYVFVSVSTQSSLQQCRRLAGVYSVCVPNLFDSCMKTHTHTTLLRPFGFCPGQPGWAVTATRAWKVDNISIWTIYRWSLCFIGFLTIQSGSRSKWGFRRNVQKCNSYITHNVFSTALRAAMMSLSFMVSRCTAPQRDHSLVDMHQTVWLLPSEACIRQCSLGEARSVIVYFSFRINTATIALKMTVVAVN